MEDSVRCDHSPSPSNPLSHYLCGWKSRNTWSQRGGISWMAEWQMRLPDLCQTLAGAKLCYTMKISDFDTTTLPSLTWFYSYHKVGYFYFLSKMNPPEEGVYVLQQQDDTAFRLPALVALKWEWRGTSPEAGTQVRLTSQHRVWRSAGLKVPEEGKFTELQREGCRKCWVSLGVLDSED